VAETGLTAPPFLASSRDDSPGSGATDREGGDGSRDQGRRAIVCASSKGLGRGCAEALAAAGVNLVMNARGAEALEAAAAAIRAAHGVEVTTVAADVTTPEGREELLAACPSPDILVTNAGGPPPGLWSDWEREDFIKALDANMLTPIALIKAVLPGMMARGWGRIVNITSQSVKAPIPALGLSNAARAGLTGYVAGTARQVRACGVTINNLLPGIHATDRADALDAGLARQKNISVEEARTRAPGDDPRPPLRHGGGVRRHVRLPLLGPRGLHRGPEHPARRRRGEFHALTG
jgi:3-oxoacyl-[acyl-carrier protein] reductase